MALHKNGVLPAGNNECGIIVASWPLRHNSLARCGLLPPGWNLAARRLKSFTRAGDCALASTMPLDEESWISSRYRGVLSCPRTPRMGACRSERALAGGQQCMLLRRRHMVRGDDAQGDRGGAGADMDKDVVTCEVPLGACCCSTAYSAPFFTKSFRIAGA